MIRLCSGVDYRPLGRAASEWIVEEGEGEGAGEGPVTKVERRRLPERSFAQDRRPFSGNKLWAPNCLCRLYLRYASAAAATDFLLQDPRGGNEFERTRRASMVLRPEKRFQVFHYLLLSIFFFKQHFKRCVYTVLCCEHFTIIAVWTRVLLRTKMYR